MSALNYCLNYASCVPLIYSFSWNNLFRFGKFNGLSFNFIVMHIGRTPLQELMIFRLDFPPRDRYRKIIKNAHGQQRAYAFVRTYISLALAFHCNDFSCLPLIDVVEMMH